MVVVAASLLVPADGLLAQSDAGGLRQRAWAWRTTGYFVEAEEDLRKSLELLPNEPIAWFRLGDILELTGRNGEAEEMFREVLRWEPGNEEAQEQLAALG